LIMSDSDQKDNNEVSWPKRILALAMISIMGFGCTFCFDSPAALQTDLKQALNMSQTEFMLLYTFYSAPNIVMCVVGGFLVDVILGKRIAAILFTFLVLTGQSVLALGVSVGQKGILYLARFIYGLGGESLITARSAYCVAWFSGSILNLAMGIALTVTRLGSTVSINLLGPMYEHFLQNSQNSTGDVEELEPDQSLLAETLALAGLSCVISFVAALILFPMDKFWAPKQETSDKDDKEEVVEEFEFVSKKAFYLDKLSYDLGAWVLYSICLFYYCSIFPMISQGIEFFQSWWGADMVDENKARHLTSAPYIISMVLVPFIGIAIDYTKKNVLWCLAANLLTGLSFVLMLVSKDLDPWVSIVILSVGFAILACALWPMVSFLVPQRKIGMAYGVMQAIQNLGLALVGLLTGVMVDSHFNSCTYTENEVEIECGDKKETPWNDECVECHRGDYTSVIILWLAFQILASIGILFTWYRHGANCESLVPLNAPPKSGIIMKTIAADGKVNKSLSKED